MMVHCALTEVRAQRRSGCLIHQYYLAVEHVLTKSRRPEHAICQRSFPVSLSSVPHFLPLHPSPMLWTLPMAPAHLLRFHARIAHFVSQEVFLFQKHSSS